MKSNFLFFSCLLFLINCNSSSKFIDSNNDESIEILNQDIKEKFVLIHLNDKEIPIESNSVLVAQDTLYYSYPNSTAIPLSDIKYLKKPPKNAGVSLLPGFALIGYGFYYGNSLSEDASIGEGIGKGIAGLTLISIGAIATVIGIAINKSKYYYFNENFDAITTNRNNRPCRNPRKKKRCE
ncbi:MAG: hypothetical protein BalsKO_14190 [Balneolaceae bacterium]